MTRRPAEGRSAVVVLHRFFLDGLAFSVRSPLFWGLALAIVVRILLVKPWLWPDSQRYLGEAESLLRGEGYATDGTLETSLPPGYPVFVAIVFRVYHSVRFLVAVQFGLSVASCWLVYRAVLPRSRALATSALYALAMHGWIAIFAGCVLSETLGIFLTSLLACYLSRHDRSPSAVGCLVLGLICSALPLTIPATFPLALGVALTIAWQNRTRFVQLGVFAVGNLLLLTPWGLHTYCAIGTVPLTLYRFPPGGYIGEGLQLWMRTWVRTQRDMSAYTQAKDFDAIPDSVFSSVNERLQLNELHARWRKALMRATTIGRRDGSDALGREHDQAFRRVGERRVREDPVRFRFVLPVIRAVHLWLDEPVYGEKPPIRFVGRIIYTGASVLYVAYVVLFVSAGALAAFRARPVPIAICAGTVVYSLASGYWAIGEERRNYEFVPLLLFLLYYWPPDLRNWLNRRWRDAAFCF